jgi:hypothetical protein
MKAAAVVMDPGSRAGRRSAGMTAPAAVAGAPPLRRDHAAARYRST